MAYKTKARALSAGRRYLKSNSTVGGVRGGRIPSSQAKLKVVKTLGGYTVIAKRK
jgi:hypothetical protein